ncbi:MAG: ABC transporter ATP-binding protein/permease [Erysipelothrix sp.]|nr:ABC transporter ATP-binding protein/permease [Erysipelothrix sp.]
MLELKNLLKEYTTGNFTQRALDQVSITFRNNEFVSILGPSGSGKTTLLNIVGGLDQYTDGDLLINGVSTKNYKDSDWDSYRNHQIGFVFQSYNLIEHQSVISNVELALALSGISKSERTRRAKEVLNKVGLIDHINKRPNQLSGGQMQRVAIARALINDPEILLADEPTGALDTETSLQIMLLLEEIAKDKLVIMVTHNAQLANKYSTRVVSLQDGRVTSDTNPVLDEEGAHGVSGQSKTKMKLSTALGLSLNNLLTKKARTILTSFAGSIGIIGIALILSLSNGVQLYINNIEKDTLASYPISIMETSFDTSELVSIMTPPKAVEDPNPDTIYPSLIVEDYINLIGEKSAFNNLSAFKEYIEDNQQSFDSLTQGIQYSYPLNLNIFKETTDGGYVQVEPNILLDDISTDTGQGRFNIGTMMNSSVITELLDDQSELDNQYDVMAGHWPTASNEVVLLADANNQIQDYALYSLGIIDREQLYENYDRIQQNLPVEPTNHPNFKTEDLIGTTFKVVLNTDIYEQIGDAWVNKADDQEYMDHVISEARELTIVGVMKAKEDTISTATSSLLGYTSALTQDVINSVNEQEIVKEQLANPEINVLSGLPFPTEDEPFSMEDLTPEQAARLASMSPEELAEVMQVYQANATASYEGVLELLGVSDLDEPSMIQLYPANFEAKDELAEMINQYNTEQEAAGRSENVITYSDIIETMMKSVTQIINIITYILIAFVAVSLVVSSIMIGIITYISVLERTKEIGILRAIGASKRDISRVFNAETLIIGLFSGLLGIGVTLLLLIPINSIILSLTDVSNLASLPIEGGIILILISVVLTLVAGIIPSRMASKKDPVEALRSE